MSYTTKEQQKSEMLAQEKNSRQVKAAFQGIQPLQSQIIPKFFESLLFNIELEITLGGFGVLGFCGYCT